MKKKINLNNYFKVINNDNNILDINAFIKLLKANQNLSNFESHKTLFLRSFYLLI